MPLPSAQVLYAAIAAAAVVAIGLLFAPGQGPVQGGSTRGTLINDGTVCVFDVTYNFGSMNASKEFWTLIFMPPYCSVETGAGVIETGGRESIGKQIQRVKE